MGQENEEKAELLATIQHEHPKMKVWYNSAPEAKSTLHAKYGSAYPSFWRDVVSWDGWKASRKLFLKSMELKEKKEMKMQMQMQMQMQNSNNSIMDSNSNPSNTTISTTSTTSGNSNSNSNDQQPGDQNNMTKRKRKSRWGVSSESNSKDQANNIHNNSSPTPPKRKSRWGDRGRDDTAKPFSTNAVPSSSTTTSAAAGTATTSSVLDILPGLPTNLNAEQSAKLKDLQQRLKEANQKLQNLEVEAKRVDALPLGHPDRSPSPPPVYGVDGKRKNTRAVRWRERYTAQKNDSLEQILSLTTSNPNATSTIAPSLFKRKRTRKIHIPVEQHPTYNFIGLIIGPRGKTQKDMESKTNCKIAIRGKGSVKEGARGRRDGKMMEGDDEPLHVVITGDNQANVDAAAEMITNMLVVIDDDKNIHKQQQLRELALLNGTLKEDEYCPICAEKGHRAFECPKRFSSSSAAKVDIKCTLCGSTSHVTRDCKMNKNPAAADGENKAEKELDSDYMAFMNELDGKAPGDVEDAKASAAADQAAAAERKQKLESLVTTIEKTAGGVTTKFAPVVPAKGTTTNTNVPSTTVVPPVSGGGSLITTISSRIIKSAPTEEEDLNATVIAAVPGVTELNNQGSVPFTAGSSVYPGVTPPITTASTTATTLPAGSATAVTSFGAPVPGVSNTTTILPPPPSSLLPPQPNYYAQQQQQQQYHHTHAYQASNYNQQTYGYQQTQQYGNNGQQGNQGQYGQQNYQNGGVAGWDYTSYYGSGDTGGDAGGAGGFNWWESS